MSALVWQIVYRNTFGRYGALRVDFPLREDDVVIGHEYSKKDAIMRVYQLNQVLEVMAS